MFALTFALGVVSGITMSFQFGTNWPGFMERVGNIAGPLLGYEVLTAFFLEAGFLGVMLFGHGKVSEKVHLMSTFLVAFGTTPVGVLDPGAELVDADARPGTRSSTARSTCRAGSAVIFNPSFPYRFTHMLLASALTCAFLLVGLSAWQVLRGVAQRSAPRVMRVGLTLAALLIPVQIFVGDLHGLNTLQHQPAKIAAMEGVWETERGAPLLLFAVPDADAAHEPLRDRGAEAGQPDPHPRTRRRDQGPEQLRRRAPAAAAGVLRLSHHGRHGHADAGHQLARLVAAAARALAAGGACRAPLLWLFAGMTFSGWVATVAGWYVTEIGRQPFIVYGLVRTADVVSARCRRR